MDASPSEPIALQAGPLRLAFDRGEVRWLRLGDREVLRGVYAAVRTADWTTVPAGVRNLRVDSSDDGFSVRFDAVHRAEGVWFEWRGALDGTPDGRIRFEMDGVARSTFLRNRIGLCVLHPVAECAGATCTVETTDGTTASGAFPRLVSPHQPFFDLRAIRHEVAPGLEAEVRFEGEVFEMEDQCNWSDASFKTYSTPLALPLPVEVRQGDRIRQAVTVTLHGPVKSAEPRTRSAARGWMGAQAVRVAVDVNDSRPLPRLGYLLGEAAISQEALARLEPLAPAHLRVDLRLSEDSWSERLAAAAEAARAMRTGLEVAAFVSAERSAAQLGALAETARGVEAPVESWLVFDDTSGTTTPTLVQHAREVLGTPRTTSPLLGGGTDGFFADLNRESTAAAGLDLVSFSLNPQVHAFDDATLVENTTSLARMAETARGFAADTPLALSPVTLLPRPGTDRRQGTLFGAGWTLGLVAAAAEAGFARLTLFELMGPGGVMDDGHLLPVGQILAELAALADSAPEVPVFRARPDDRARCLSLALRAGRLLRVYVFNPTLRPLDVVVTGLPSVAWQRSFHSAAGVESALGGATGEQVTATSGGHALRLGGHDILALDAEAETP